MTDRTPSTSDEDSERDIGERPDTPEIEVDDDQFRCADCGKVFSEDDAWQRSDLSALICEACSASGEDWQCYQCCYMRAGWQGAV